MQCCGLEHEAAGDMEGDSDGPTKLAQQPVLSSVEDVNALEKLGLVLEKLGKLEVEVSSIRGTQERMENSQARVEKRISECFSGGDGVLGELKSTLKCLAMQFPCPRAVHPCSFAIEAPKSLSNCPADGGHNLHPVPTPVRQPQPCHLEDEVVEPPEFCIATKETEEKAMKTSLKESDAGASASRRSIESKRSSKPSDEFAGKVQKDGWVDHPAFDCFFGFMIIANAGCIGAEVEHRTRVQGEDGFANALRVSSFVFCFVFVVELVLRVRAKGRQLLTDKKEKWWNIFDIAMVIVSIVEALQLVIVKAATDDENDVGNSTGVGGLLVRVVRMIRLLRIVRIMRFSAQLRLVIFVIFESVKGLLWIILLLMVIFYVFSIIFTMGASQFLHQQVPDNFNLEKLQSVEEFYGTLVRSAYTCFKAMTGGQSWGELLDPLIDVGIGYALVFLFYIVFSVLVLLNIITMVFVEGAMVKSQHERDNIVEREVMAKRKAAENLKDIFNENDQDASGEISLKEFRALCGDERVVAYMTALGIEVEEADGLFAKLDLDGSGSIEADEFVQNLLALVGGVKIQEQIQKMMHECHTVMHDLKGFMKYVEDEFGQLKTAKPSQKTSHGIPDCFSDGCGSALNQARVEVKQVPATRTPQLLESHTKARGTSKL